MLNLEQHQMNLSVKIEHLYCFMWFNHILTRQIIISELNGRPFLFLLSSTKFYLFIYALLLYIFFMIILFISFANWASPVQQRSDGVIATAPCVELHQLACEGSLIDFPLRYLAQWDTNVIWSLTQYLTTRGKKKQPGFSCPHFCISQEDSVTYGKDFQSSHEFSFVSWVCIYF